MPGSNFTELLILLSCLLILCSVIVVVFFRKNKFIRVSGIIMFLLGVLLLASSKWNFFINRGEEKKKYGTYLMDKESFRTETGKSVQPADTDLVLKISEDDYCFKGKISLVDKNYLSGNWKFVTGDDYSWIEFIPQPGKGSVHGIAGDSGSLFLDNYFLNDEINNSGRIRFVKILTDTTP